MSSGFRALVCCPGGHILWGHAGMFGCPGECIQNHVSGMGQFVEIKIVSVNVEAM